MSGRREKERVMREFRGQFSIDGAIDTAFELFSPLGERKWVPGWNPELLYPPDVTWAVGQIFRTQEEKGEAIWIVTRLDREARRVEYHRVEPGRYVARVRVDCRAAARDVTEVVVEYTFMALSPEGAAEIDAMTDEAYAEKMTRWKRWTSEWIAPR